MTYKQHRYFMTLKRPEDIYDLAQIISSSFPSPDGVFTAVYELLLNAIEHGNLGIGFSDKFELLRKGIWQEEVEKRLTHPEYANRSVEIEVVEDNNTVTVSITDQGDGFNWKEQLQRNLQDDKPHGRGLWIAQNSSFDRIEFNKQGNRVQCLVYMKDKVIGKIGAGGVMPLEHPSCKTE